MSRLTAAFHRSRRLWCGDAAVAALVAIVSTAVVGWHTLRMPPHLEQFSKYPLAALQFLHGVPLAERLVDFSPLYLALHAAAARWLADPFTGMLVFQAVCIGLAAAFVFTAARRVGAVPLAVAGAAALALERSVVAHGHVFEPESLLLLFTAAWLSFALRRGAAAAAAAGAALALALLTRPTLLPLAVVVPAAEFLQPEARRRALVASLPSLLPVAAAVLLLALHNHRATGSWYPVVMNPGTVFYDGNNPLGPGYAAAYPPVVREVAAARTGEADFEHAVYRQLARSDAGRKLTVNEVNLFWAGKALHFLRDEPAAALRRLLRKAFFAFHRYRWNDLTAANAAERVLEERRMPGTPLALLSALAIAGAGFGLRNWRELFPAYALLGTQLAVMLATYTSARQRIALLPALCFFAVLAVTRLARGGRGTLALGGGVLLLSALLWRETDLMREHRHLYFPLRADAVRAEDVELGRWERALALFAAGEHDEAEPLFEGLRRSGWSSLRGEPAFFLGRIAMLRERRVEAVGFMREALARAPGHPVVLAQLAALTGEPRYAAPLHRYLDRADALYLLGDSLLQGGRFDEAVAALESLVTAVPAHEQGHDLLRRARSARAAAPGSAPRPETSVPAEP